ncbi:MAG: FAD-dependent oxidoreductase [Parasporobacterium sp.]|nr:FAD-dependent oxidoreductase [Parasporobacterium sp.]
MYNEWEQAHPNAARTIWPELKKLAGFNALPLPSNRNDICWVNNWHENRDCSTIKDLTETEINTRINIRKVIEFLREAVPAAFEHAFLYDIAPQTGLRCSKRLKGEYIMSPKDFAFETHFDDVIAWHSTICQINDCGPVEIPYRAILPQKIDGLLCPGRHLSADNVSIDWLNLIPQCVGTGQAAGVAAAVAIQQGTGTHDVDIRTVQDILVEQDVPLPRNEKFHAIDPTYQECVEEHQYGLYTALAAKYREEGDNVKVYHW